MKRDETELTSALQPAGMKLPGAAAVHPHLSIPDHELLHPIGRGAYGEVWLGRTTLGTPRAIKVIYRRSFENDRPYEREFSGIQRFEPISRAHEGFVDVLQVGRNDTGGYFYYVMELADDVAAVSRTLRRLLRPPAGSATGAPAQERLPIEACLQVALTLTSALGRLHKEGLVHRDIKPSNIIFVGGVPKLADIGLVASVTEARSFVGTEGFIPPEGPGSVQADLYSLGKVLYEASTGKDRHEFPALPADARELPDRAQLIEFNEVVLKACHHDPQRRYQSAAEMHADLALLQSGKSVRHVRQLERRLERMKKYGLAAAAVVLLAGGVTLVQKHQAGLARKHAEESDRLRQRADEQRQRAEKAEAEGEGKLWQAYLAQARANRWSGKAGRRFDTLTAISNAALLPPTLIASNKLALRNEAIAAMALVDLRVTKEWTPSHSNVSYTVFEPSFERYARADLDTGQISVRRVADEIELFTLPGLGARADSFLCFSPDARFIGAQHRGRSGKTLFRLWNLDTRTAVLEFDAAEPGTVDFSPNAQWIAIAPHSVRALVVYELTSGKEWKRINTSGPGARPAFSPDSKRVAAVTDSTIDIHDVATGDVLVSYAIESMTWQGDWSADGKLFATGHADSRIRIWEVGATNRLSPRFTLEGHTASGIQIRFARQASLLASSSWDGTTRLWDSHSGTPLLALSDTIFDFSPDDKWLAFYSERQFGLWELAKAHEYRTLHASSGQKGFANFSPDGRLFATANRDGVRLLDMRTDRELCFLPLDTAADVLFHPSGTTLYTSSPDGLFSWPMRYQTNATALQLGPPVLLRKEIVFRTDISLDGRAIVGIKQGGALLLRLDDSALGPQSFRHANCDWVSISPDSRWVATGNWKGRGVKIWDTRTGKELKEIVPEANVNCRFSPDGRWLVTASLREYRFWEVGTWQPCHAIPRHSVGGLAGHIRFTRDATMVAINQTRMLVKLVEAATGAEIATLEAGPQWPLCFSPDGAQLAVSAEKGSVHLWDLHSIRQQLAALNLDWDPAEAPSDRKSVLPSTANTGSRPHPTEPATLTVTVLTNGTTKAASVRHSSQRSE